MRSTLRLFQKYGLELEYMVVNRSDLAVAPVVDRIMIHQTGEPVGTCVVGQCEVSNELAAHVFELKVPAPIDSITRAESSFVDAIRETNRILSVGDWQLLPGAMHPLMDPVHESTTWAHEGRDIYETYDRIFDCHGHGWFNLQSCHLNLPFGDDDEFGLLHAAIILILPFLPALSAGSPFIEGKVSGLLDTRLDVYRRNQQRFPSISGMMVPEPAFTRADYERMILQPMYREISPVDPESVLQEEWLNSRAAIARFDRGAIEIRLLDVQECPRADMAICELIVHTLKWLVEHRDPYLKKWALRSSTEKRRDQLLEVIKAGRQAEVVLPDIREAFRLPTRDHTAGELWGHILEKIGIEPLDPEYRNVIEFILTHGNLAERQLKFHAATNGARPFEPLMREMGACLEENRQLDPSKNV
ncbi:MAG: glutamate-cysteine ligase family protein [Opitutaceae bacterium]